MGAFEKVKLLTKDLRTGYPRSPRTTLAGYVIAARALDKCRAEIMGWQGDYHYDCPLSHTFLDFAGIKASDFKDFVATGASDEEVAAWITEHAIHRDRMEIIRWNNLWREMKVSELSDKLQLFLEGYVKDALPPNSHPYTFFDIYDIEEKRLPSLVALSD